MFDKILQKMKSVLRKAVGLEDFREYEEDKRDPSELTEAELWVRKEIEYDRFVNAMFTFKCFGVHYSESYLRSKPAEEIYEQWQEEVASLQEYTEECIRKRKEEMRIEAQRQEELAQEKAEKRQKRAERVQRLKSRFHPKE